MIREFFESLKELILDYIKHRLFPVTVLVIVLFSILINRLFTLQIIEGEKHLENFIYKSEKTITVEAVRGNIYDRNGKLLAYNELSYSVIYSNNPGVAAKAEELGIKENHLKNKILYDTIKILESNGDKLYLDFPIELSEAGEYSFTVSDTQLKNFLKNVYSVNTFDELSDEEKNSTAEEIVLYLSNDLFEISEEYSPRDRLNILGCRYKLWLNRFQQYVPVTLAYNISEKSNAAINEYSDELLGIEVSVKSLRKYNDAKYFAHIMGYTGTISAEEMEQYNASLPASVQYTNKDTVGKTGIEQYCEAYLRGVNGSETIYVDNLGKIIERVETVPATAGNDIYLTIDADLQKYAYDTLEKEIASILLTNLVNQNTVIEEENGKIPITAVYFGLFDNNYLSIYNMGNSDASVLEREIYVKYTQNKESTLTNIDNILTKDFTPLSELSSEYQEYMEYICEILSYNDIFDTSLISSTDQEFINYTNNLTSLEHYLKYAISIEAIDISSFEAKSDYYDTEEIYALLCDYIINYLNLDTEFDKLIIKNMIQSAEISGYDIVDLLYEQGILSTEGDLEYTEFKNGAYGPYEFMVRKIRNLEITPAMLALKPCSGSVVITDVQNGDVLAMVSYPSYDNNYLANEIDATYYNKLLEDKTTPLINRTTMQRTAPGSTYKILSAVASLNEGVIDYSTYFYCSGPFEKVDPSPYCWAHPSAHGGLDVVGGIQHSCNIFFYNVGYYLACAGGGGYDDAYGIDLLGKYAKEFGLNDLSGVELPEIQPNVSDNDAVRSAIGQGRNSYAPIQLSRYVTTIANSGTCYNLTLIDKITDYEGNILVDNQATVINTIDIDQGIWDTVHAGMRLVISQQTSQADLINQVNVSVAGKTGTAQESETKPNHALFISYAPYENPEVSVTCVIQNGYSSGNAKEVAGFIYAYIYDPEELINAEISGDTEVSD
ncbi:MAG: hypothetical protein E7258_09570 [Lachnospiraceae bacterium]|nr:hypothetical protein [Lachnospiraceae bacterium]